jgi:hypothetical protein
MGGVWMGKSLTAKGSSEFLYTLLLEFKLVLIRAAYVGTFESAVGQARSRRTLDKKRKRAYIPCVVVAIVMGCQYIDHHPFIKIQMKWRAGEWL